DGKDAPYGIGDYGFLVESRDDERDAMGAIVGGHYSIPPLLSLPAESAARARSRRGRGIATPAPRPLPVWARSERARPLSATECENIMCHFVITSVQHFVVHAEHVDVVEKT